MKTFLSKIQNFFSNSSDEARPEHLEDLTEGDEGIDDVYSLEDEQIVKQDE